MKKNRTSSNAKMMNMMIAPNAVRKGSTTPARRYSEPIQLEADYTQPRTIESLAARRREFEAIHKGTWVDADMPSDL